MHGFRQTGSKLAASLLLLLALLVSCGCCRLRQYSDIKTQTPLLESEILVIGFMGGRDSWWDEEVGVGRLAAQLRKREMTGIHLETIENLQRGLALKLVQAALDRNQDRMLQDAERQSARIILYGQSFGGAAVVKFARQLNKINVPVLLTVQVDSIGRDDEVIPPNVMTAANLYQSEGRMIRGASNIRAADPNRTRILYNWRFDYRNKQVKMRELPWYKKAFRTAHVKMDNDPEVWGEVERLIVDAIQGAER